MLGDVTRDVVGAAPHSHGPVYAQRPRVSALWLLLTACALLVLTSVWTLAAEDELSFGRKPWQNLQKTVAEMSEPSFLRVWFSETRH